MRGTRPLWSGPTVVRDSGSGIRDPDEPEELELVELGTRTTNTLGTCQTP